MAAPRRRRARAVAVTRTRRVVGGRPQWDGGGCVKVLAAQPAVRVALSSGGRPLGRTVKVSLGNKKP